MKAGDTKTVVLESGNLTRNVRLHHLGSELTLSVDGGPKVTLKLDDSLNQDGTREKFHVHLHGVVLRRLWAETLAMEMEAPLK